MSLFKRRPNKLEQLRASGLVAAALDPAETQEPAPRYELTHAPGGTTDHLITPGATVTLCRRERGADWHPGGGRRQCGLCSEIAGRDNEGLVAS